MKAPLCGQRATGQPPGNRDVIPIPDKNCFNFFPELKSRLPKQAPKP
jgi:hypothetical protein